MLTTGVDIIEIERVERSLQRWGQRFLERVYTPAEVAYCRGRVPELAVRFAAKEAAAKALGTGIWARGGVWWQDVEVLPDGRGKPLLHLHGRAAERARQLGLTELAVSLSHSNSNAIAFVVAQ